MGWDFLLKSNVNILKWFVHPLYKLQTSVTKRIKIASMGVLFACNMQVWTTVDSAHNAALELASVTPDSYQIPTRVQAAGLIGGPSLEQHHPLLANINLQLLPLFCLAKLPHCPSIIENKHHPVLKHCVNMPGNWLHVWMVRLPDTPSNSQGGNQWALCAG